MTRCTILFPIITMLAVTPGVAHDFISSQFIDGEKTIADLQKARDQILALPTTSAQTKEAATTFVATAFLWDEPSLLVCFWQTDQLNLLQAIKAP